MPGASFTLCILFGQSFTTETEGGSHPCKLIFQTNYTMIITELLQKELQQEAVVTRKMLALVPEDKYSWKPHERSMSMIQLATHIAELPSWIGMGLNTEGIDFANNGELLALFEKNLAEADAQLAAFPDASLNGTWTMRAGEHVIAVLSKYDTIRHAISQTIHHRAQLGVFLRLLNIPIPGTYGPSADDSGGF
jgi:uncharacterized damage-inducible protein DinB